MINRELIRIKIAQLAYTYYRNNNRNMDNAEEEPLFSLVKAYDFYNHLSALIISVAQEECHCVEIAATRANRRGTEAPSNRFATDKFAVQSEENKQLNLSMKSQKRRWEDDMEAVRKLCDQIEQNTIYQEYIASDDDSYEADREVWRKIYRTLIQENPDLDTVSEEKSLYWNDDEEVVDTFVIKIIKRFDPVNGADQELLPEYRDEEDRDFALKLFRSTTLNADDYQRYMSEPSRDWDFSHLAYMNVVIMQIATTEILTFPNIPVTVTISEYAGLAKLYSTPRSGGCTNGMLDTIARHLIQTGKMMRTMPGPRQYRPRNDCQEERVPRREGRRPMVAQTSAQRVAYRQQQATDRAKNKE